jgi:hypothetical protein
MTIPSGIVMPPAGVAEPAGLLVGAATAGGSGGGAKIGISVMPHLGHLPGLSERTSLSSHRYFLERGTRGGTDFVPVRDVPGGSGTLDARITINILEPGVTSPDDAGGEPLADSGNAGQFPSNGLEEGTADAREIDLADRDGHRLSLRINPVTSRVQIAAVQPP